MTPTTHYFRIKQDSIVVVSGFSADRDRLLSEMDHYATVYAQDGPITIEVRSGKGQWRRFVP